MKPAWWLAVALLAIPAFAANCPSGQSKNESALIDLEHTWARALEKHDADTVACILGEEFQDADPDGHLHDRNDVLSRISNRRPGSNDLSEMHAHVYGDAAYVRGLNTIKDTNGAAVAAVRFTDIFVYREGAWHAVAGHETLVKAEK